MPNSFPPFSLRVNEFVDTGMRGVNSPPGESVAGIPHTKLSGSQFRNQVAI